LLFVFWDCFWDEIRGLFDVMFVIDIINRKENRTIPGTVRGSTQDNIYKREKAIIRIKGSAG